MTLGVKKVGKTPEVSADGAENATVAKKRRGKAAPKPEEAGPGLAFAGLYLA